MVSELAGTDIHVVIGGKRSPIFEMWRTLYRIQLTF